jgi:type IV pilus assembly protein PilM
MKAVELRSSPKTGLAISAVAVSSTPPGVLQNGMLTDPVLMAQGIRQMLKEAGIRSKRVIGCIAGQSSVVVRIIEVPRMTPAELAETMKWEVERHVPFAPTEVEMDYQPLPAMNEEEANNPNMSVLLAVAQKDMVNYYVETLLKSGLDPAAIDIEPLAAGRALLDIDVNGQPIKRKVRPIIVEGGDIATEQEPTEPEAPTETVAVVNIGSSNTDISIFEDGMLIFPRSLALAGESLTKAISEVLGYQAEQAERLKIEHGKVLMDRMGEYANQGYADAVDFPYGQPDEEGGRAMGGGDSGPLGSRSPFDSGPLQPRSPFESGPLQPRSPFETGPISGNLGSDRIVSGPLGSGDRINSGPLGQPSAFDVDPAADPNAPAALDLERTQPIQRRALDLARRGAGGGGAAGGGFDGSGQGNPEADSLTIQIFDAILPVLSELATELRRSLDYYRSRAAGKNVDRVILCGGTASLPGIDQFLQAELQVPVQIANPFSGLSVTTKSFDSRYLESIAPVFTVAVGLAERNAVFAANPEPSAKKTKVAAAAPAAAGAGAPKAKAGFKMPSFSFGKKGKAAGGGNTTSPPTS